MARAGQAPLVGAAAAPHAEQSLLNLDLLQILFYLGGGLLLAGAAYVAYRRWTWREAARSHRLAALVAERTHALQESQERLRGLSEATFEAVAIHEQGRILEVNQAACELTGYDREALVGMHMDQLVTPAWHSRARLYLQQQRQEPYELEILRADGSTIPAEMRARTVHYQGRVVRVAAVRDLTARKRVAEALREERDFSTAIIDTIAALVIVLDRQGRIVRFNSECEQTSGYRAAEVVGQYIWDLPLISVEDQAARQAFQDLLAVPRPAHYESLWHAKDGSVRLIDWSSKSLLSAAGELEYLIGMGIDITERRQTEESLRKLSRAVEHSASTIVITGLDGAIEFANPAFTRITGYSQAEVLGQNPRLLKSGVTPPEVYQDLWETLIRGDVWQGELLNRKKDGALYWENAVISPVPDATGQITHYVAIKEDITARRQIEETLKQNQARLKTLYELTQKDFSSEQALIEDALEAGVRLTGSQFGYFHFVENPPGGGEAAAAAPSRGGGGVRLFTWSTAAQAACALDAGEHASMSTAGVWADCIRSGQPAVHNDFPNLPKKTGVPVGHPPLERHMSVPIFDQGQVVVVCGVANKFGPYEDSDALQLQLFMDGVWRVVVRQRVEAALRQRNDALRQRMQEIESLQAQLREQALRDPLTGAFNRRYLVETLERELAQTERAGQPLSLVIMDMDFFKVINDTYGHQAGDVALLGLVGLLTRCTRKGDVVCRYGGEEFVVLLPETTREDAFRRAEEWRLAFAETLFEYKSISFNTTISLGLATHHGAYVPGATADDLLRSADQALYMAKNQGRNRTVVV